MNLNVFYELKRFSNQAICVTVVYQFSSAVDILRSKKVAVEMIAYIYRALWMFVALNAEK